MRCIPFYKELQSKLTSNSTYLFLILEKAIKMFSSFIIIFLLKYKAESLLLGNYALIEMASITFFKISIFGTGVISQREMGLKDSLLKLNVFINIRIIISLLIFILAIILFPYTIGNQFSLLERILIFSFLIFSPIQTFEYFLYAQQKFKEVYKYRIIIYIISFLLKILTLLVSPKLIVFTISLEYLLLFLVYFSFLKKYLVFSNFRNNITYFFKQQYFKTTSLLFIGSILVVLFNQVLFSLLRYSSSLNIIGSLYIFLKFAEGFNFISVNVGLMKIPNYKGTSLFMFPLIKEKIKENLVKIVFVIIGLILFFCMCYFIYKISNYFLLGVLAFILFTASTYQTFLSINMIFKKKEKMKMIMNALSLLFLTLFLLVTINYNSLILIIYSIILSKFFSVLFLYIINRYEK